MPGVVGDMYAGTKIWYATGADAGRLAGSSAAILLLDPELGEVLLDGALITDLRTGAMTGVAVRQLARPGASVLGADIQAGPQALAVAHAQACRGADVLVAATTARTPGDRRCPRRCRDRGRPAGSGVQAHRTAGAQDRRVRCMVPRD